MANVDQVLGMSNGKTIPPLEEEPSELARFRAEWRAELESRKRSTQSNTTGTETASAPGSPTPTGLPFVFPVLRPKEQGTSTISALSGSHPAIAPDGRVINPQRTKGLDDALRIYRQAVLHEQAGDLDEALLFYRQAFRMVCRTSPSLIILLPMIRNSGV